MALYPVPVSELQLYALAGSWMAYPKTACAAGRDSPQHGKGKGAGSDKCQIGWYNRASVAS
jgi:hypothetical protein